MGKTIWDGGTMYNQLLWTQSSVSLRLFSLTQSLSSSILVWYSSFYATSNWGKKHLKWITQICWLNFFISPFLLLDWWLFYSVTLVHRELTEMIQENQLFLNVLKGLLKIFLPATSCKYHLSFLLFNLS